LLEIVLVHVVFPHPVHGRECLVCELFSDPRWSNRAHRENISPQRGIGIIAFLDRSFALVPDPDAQCVRPKDVSSLPAAV
jgi:hypothetical protein